jgi:hypothetical protein
MFNRLLASPLALLSVLPALALAQVGPASGATAAPVVPTATASSAAPSEYRSALESYQPYTEEKIRPWKEANDTVGRIGGWRAYAKEAQQPAAADNAVPKAATQPDPLAGNTKP